MPALTSVTAPDPHTEVISRRQGDHLKVLIALDESDVSRHAAAEALRLFETRDTEFLVINVAAAHTAWLYPASFGGIAPMPALDLRQLVSPSDSIAAARAVAEHAGLDDARVIAEIGDPAQCICAAADDNDVDMIVVGSHDRGALSRLLSTSVAAGVERGTHRPVLVVSGRPHGSHHPA